MEKVSKVTSKRTDAKKENSVSKKRKPVFSRSVSSPVDQVLFLQRTIGNQAVQRLFKSGAIRAELRIGQPNDKYEQEADRVAAQVMRMPEPKMQRQVEEDEEEPIQAKPLVDQITPLAQRQREEDEEEDPIQPKPLADQITPVVQRQVEPGEEEEIQAKLTCCSSLR